MAATGRSSGSSVICPLSSSQRYHHHHHHHQRSTASPCNINLRLKRLSPGNTSKPSVAVSNHQKRKCLCSPTTHPGSFRCAHHRRLENEKIKNLDSSSKRNSCCGNNTNTTSSHSRLNLRKTALMNSLARIATEEAERFRKYLASTMVKTSVLHIRRLCREFRPRPSRFYALHKDQD